MPREQKKGAPSLVYIEEPPENRCPVVWQHLTEKGFDLTSPEICSLLRCDRSYISKFIQPNVKHIFLNSRIRAGLCNWLSFKNDDFDEDDFYGTYRHYYYYSRKSFFDYINQIAVATRQTAIVDASLYMSQEQIDDLAFLRSRRESIKGIVIGEALKIKLIDDDIKFLYTISGLPPESEYSRTAPEILVPLDISEDLIKNFLRPSDLSKTREVAYRDAYVRCMTKIKVFGKTFFCEAPTGGIFTHSMKDPLLISYELWQKINEEGD